jgi:hypothetical protein
LLRDRIPAKQIPKIIVKIIKQAIALTNLVKLEISRFSQIIFVGSSAQLTIVPYESKRTTLFF